LKIWSGASIGGLGLGGAGEAFSVSVRLVERAWKGHRAFVLSATSSD